MSRPKRLLDLALRLGRVAKSRFPVDENKTVDENISVDPHNYPGILSETLGGPDRKRHRPHQYEGPRGIASSEDEEEDEPKEASSCPPAAKDKDLDRKNKLKTAEKHAYGPNPVGSVDSSKIGVYRGYPVKGPEGNEDYWQQRAGRLKLSIKAAKRQLCGNCAAFNISDDMINCGGASNKKILIPHEDGKKKPRKTSIAGYCEMHDFRCSAFKSCDTWAGGGPKTEGGV